MDKKIYLTVDVECHDYNRRNQYIDGKHRDQIAGLEKILMLGKELSISINFFFDVVEGFRYGEEYVREVIDLIKKYNQPVFLHLHPNYVSSDDSRMFLWEYGYEEKKEILRKGFEYFKQLTGEDSKFFRIGCYGADVEMYQALKELDLNVIDLSYCYNNNNMCHISEFEKKNVPFLYEKQLVFPNTRYRSFKLSRFVKHNNLDVSETTLDEWKTILRKNKLSQITCTMHSWNFIKKYFFSGRYVRLDNNEVRRFNKMIRFAKSNDYVFDSLDNFNYNVVEDDQVIDMCQGFWGKVRMLFNNYFRFRKIGRLNKFYFFFFAIIETICIIACSLIAISIIMN